MRKRTLAREFAMKALYQLDIRGALSDQDLENIVQTEDLGRMPDFGRQLATGFFASREEIDEIICRVATNWRIDRMPVVDRNILRLATYELLYVPDTPPKVVINEAIELAKKYGTEDSPTFVNGVMDKVYSIYAEPRRSSTDNLEEIERISMTQIQDIAADPLAKADLHLHSIASDGSLAPLDLLHRARAQDLKAIAIADHDSIDAVAEATIEAEKMDIYLVPAVELTSYTHPEDEERQHELHILGYFVNANDPEFKEELTRLRRIRAERVHKIAAALDAIDIDIDADTIIKNTHGSVGRVHVALELMRKGICSNLQEAFQKYIGMGKPAYVPKEQLTPKVAIQLIHNAGGCAVIAHPGVTEGLDDTWEELVEAGIDGIEVHYPAHTAEEEAKWLDRSRRLDLVVTGGSDFHGEAKPDVEIGQETVSMVEVHNLLERANERRRTPLSADETTS